MMLLRLTGGALAGLHRSLFERSPDEGAAFLAVEPFRNRLVLNSFRVFSGDELETGEGGELAIKKDAQLAALKEIKRKGHHLIEVHTHPFTKSAVRFSSFDEEQLPSFASYVMNKLGQQGFGALVFGQESISGRWCTRSNSETLELEILGQISESPNWAMHRIIDNESESRFDRQLRALGPFGQARVTRLKVGVIGLGGTGSQVVQQMAHLGVKEFVLVDDDIVEESNLPRLAGATTKDTRQQTEKAAVAERLILGLTSDATIQRTGTLRKQSSLSALAEADLIIGCVDNDGARLILAEFAAAGLIPYIDIGVGVEADGAIAAAGGRIGFQLPAGPCLACADEIDFGEAAEDLEAEELRKIRIARGYARDRRIEPALMPLNTSVVGLASIEIIAYVTGFRDVVPFWRYDAISQSVTRLNVTVNEECPVCRPALAMGDRQAIERYTLG